MRYLTQEKNIAIGDFLKHFMCLRKVFPLLPYLQSNADFLFKIVILIIPWPLTC